MTVTERVQKKVSLLRKELQSRPVLLHADIAELVDNAFKQFGAKVVMEKVSKQRNFISVGGEYLIGRKRQPIRIQIAVSKYSDRIKLSKRTLDGILFLLFQILLHELRHKHQYRYRDSDCDFSYYLTLDDQNLEMDEDQTYLAELDEIDAYAGDIALELFRYCPQTYRQEMSSITHPKIQSYHYYRKVFEGTEWSEIRKNLMRKVFKHVEEIERTKGWYKNV